VPAARPQRSSPMKNSHLRFAAAFAIAIAAPAFAADQVRDLSSGAGSFVGTVPVLDGGADTLTFINLPAGEQAFVFSLSTQSVDGLAVSINGSPATVTTVGAASFASLAGSVTGPVEIVL